jgi:hypothetical protein
VLKWVQEIKGEETSTDPFVPEMSVDGNELVWIKSAPIDPNKPRGNTVANQMSVSDPNLQLKGDGQRDLVAWTGGEEVKL